MEKDAEIKQENRKKINCFVLF